MTTDGNHYHDSLSQIAITFHISKGKDIIDNEEGNSNFDESFYV